MESMEDRTMKLSGLLLRLQHRRRFCSGESLQVLLNGVPVPHREITFRDGSKCPDLMVAITAWHHLKIVLGPQATEDYLYPWTGLIPGFGAFLAILTDFARNRKKLRSVPLLYFIPSV
jgi:hypothetical protein